MEPLMYDAQPFQDSDSECLSSPVSSPHHDLALEQWSPDTLAESGSWMWDEVSTDSTSYSSSSSLVDGPSVPTSVSSISTPIAPVLDCASFVTAVTKGQLSSMPVNVLKGLQPVTLDMAQLSAQLVVRRRELEPSSPFFHSIRTRTASIVSACFVGGAEQVLAMARRIPKLYFSESAFMDACENAQSAVENVMLCVTMRRATKWATFSYAHDATMFPEPLIFQNPSNPAVFMVAFEFLLTAVDTTIRNLDGQRELMIDLDVLVPRMGAEAQTAFSEFFVRVDIQPGASGRHRVPGQRRRVYKRAPTALPVTTTRKMQQTRPLDELDAATDFSASSSAGLILRLRVNNSVVQQQQQHHHHHQQQQQQQQYQQQQFQQQSSYPQLMPFTAADEEISSLAMLAKMEEMAAFHALSSSYLPAAMMPESMSLQQHPHHHHHHHLASHSRYVALPPPPPSAALFAQAGAFLEPSSAASMLHSASPAPGATPATAAAAVAAASGFYPSQSTSSFSGHLQATPSSYHPHALMPQTPTGPCYYGFHC